jgi:hypothetical protein
MVRLMAATTMDGVERINPLLCVGDMAVRFADEGVPVRAIARAVRISPELIRDYLQKAYHRGQLFELPKDDWSPGLRRDARVPELDHIVEKHENLYPQAMRCFNLTPQQARMLLVLIKYPLVSRERLHAVGSRCDGDRESSLKVVDVQICNLRKRLERCKLDVHAHFGVGYYLTTEHRRKASQKLLDYAKR